MGIAILVVVESKNVGCPINNEFFQLLCIVKHYSAQYVQVKYDWVGVIYHKRTVLGYAYKVKHVQACHSIKKGYN